MRSRTPITVAAPLLIGVLVLAVGAWLSLIWRGHSRDAVTDLAQKNIEQVHKLAATEVSNVISIPVRICAINAQLIRSGALDPDDLSTWSETLIHQARAFEALSAISWGSADGRTAWISRYGDGAYYWAIKDDSAQDTIREWRLDQHGDRPDAPTNTYTFDLMTRPWFRTPVDAGAATWSEPFVWVGGDTPTDVTLGLSYGIPVYDDDESLVGVIDADFSLNDLTMFLQTIRLGETGVAALVSGDGRLLATSADASILDDEQDRLRLGGIADEMLAATAPVVAEARRSNLLEVEPTHVDINGNRHDVHVTAIGRSLGLDWLLVTIVPERDFTAAVESQFRRSSIASLIAVLIALSIGFIAARWLVSPVRTLVSTVRRIGEGDLDTHVTIQHAPEYVKLAEAINDMTEGLRDRMRMRESLSLAMEVQKNLLPSSVPSVPQLDIAGHSTYCDETGGDYYDFLDVSDANDESVVVAIGDVMGHGVAAAMLMATARGILRSRCAVEGSLADFLEHLNAMLVPDTRGERFMTMLLITISAVRQELRWASAGHGPPIIYDLEQDRFPELDGGGLPLGLIETEEYEEYREHGLCRGQIILAATDGLWETKSESGELFGMDRVHEILRTHGRQSAADISGAIRATLADFRGELDQDDDLTYLIIKVQ